MKNPTPSRVVLNTALSISFLLLLVALLGLAIIKPFPGWLILFLPFLSFIFSYFILRFAIEKFIYRKIKVIYKSILEQKKLDTLDKKVKMNEHLIEKVSLDVSNWAIGKEKEIKGLKEMEQYRREFVGNVSHELKTPIFNIQGYLHTLIDGGINDEKINMDYLHKAAKNVKRLNSIVQDLEEISMLESGSVAMTITSFDIKKLVGEVLESLVMMADNYNVKISFKDDDLNAILVKADREKIRQVLANLLSNSIKYGKDNGRTRIGFYDFDKNILIEISDNGIGIEKEHVPRLFERFYRADKSRSRLEGGTGLGLSIVKHIIEAHQQTINVRSTPGVGSTFGFTLQKA